MCIYLYIFPNVYPGPLSFVKQPVKAKTAQFPKKMKESKKSNIF